MNFKLSFLMKGALVAMLAMVSACGDEPTDDPIDTDSEVEQDTLQVDNSPIQDLTTLVGKKYVLDFSKQYWTKPSGTAGEELGGYTPKFAFEITAVNADNTFTATLGTAKDGVQDMCNKTFVLQGTLTQGASTTFATTPLDIQTIIEGPEVSALATLSGFTLSGQFVNQGAGFKAGGLVAELDGREIYDLFTIMEPNPTTADELCETLSTAGVYCTACTFETTAVYCVAAEAALFKVSEAPGLTLAPVADFDQGCLQ